MEIIKVSRSFPKGEDGILAARSGDIRGASRARRPRERDRGDDGSARRSGSSARGSPARGASALDPRRGRALLRTERRDDVLVARLRRRRLSACLALWFVFRNFLQKLSRYYKYIIYSCVNAYFHLSLYIANDCKIATEMSLGHFSRRYGNNIFKRSEVNILYR